MCRYMIVDLLENKDFAVEKDSTGYFIHIEGWTKNFYIEESNGGVPTLLRDEKLDNHYTLKY